MQSVLSILVERGSAVVATALKPEDVTARAGKSRSSYYRTEGFPAADLGPGDESRTAVLEAALRRSLVTSASELGQITGGIEEFIRAGWRDTTPAEFMQAIAEENFDETGGHFLVEQLFAAALAASSPTIALDLGVYYTEVTKGYAEAYAKLIEFLGYRVRPPFTTDHMATALMALAEGLAMRSIADPSIDRTMFGSLIALVASTMVLAPGEQVDPADPRDRHVAIATTPPRRSEIIEHLIRMFATIRDDVPSIPELASRVGCAPSTIAASFGSVAGVVRAAWQEWAPEFVDSVERDRASLHEPDPLTLLYRAAVLVATRAAEHRSMTRALLMSEVGSDHHAALPSEPVVDLFERLLAEAVQRGEFAPPAPMPSMDDDARLWLFAMALRNTLFHIVVNAPLGQAAAPADHGRASADYVWALMMPARRTGSTSTPHD
ncbi:MAG: TetR/AcrR family transcriptional regulator [Ilumatobacteraceae bacterium]